jgi:hypothetical protein
MRKGVLIVGVATTVFGLLVPNLFSALAQALSRNVEVGPLQSLNLSYKLDAGERVEGYFTVRGEEQIMFYIRDSHDDTIHNASRVRGEYNFAFAVETSGIYTLYFDNSFGSTSKYVHLTLNIVPAIVGVSLPFIFLASGLIVTAVGAFLKEREEIPTLGQDLSQL